MAWKYGSKQRIDTIVCAASRQNVQKKVYASAWTNNTRIAYSFYDSHYHWCSIWVFVCLQMVFEAPSELASCVEYAWAFRCCLFFFVCGSIVVGCAFFPQVARCLSSFDFEMDWNLKCDAHIPWPTKMSKVGSDASANEWPQYTIFLCILCVFVNVRVLDFSRSSLKIDLLRCRMWFASLLERFFFFFLAARLLLANYSSDSSETIIAECQMSPIRI